MKIVSHTPITTPAPQSISDYFFRDESPDGHGWFEVETFLRFERNYTPGRSPSLDPAEMVHIYMARDIYTWKQICEIRDIGPHIIETSVRKVSRAEEIISKNGECEMTPAQKRAHEIYLGMTAIPPLVRSHFSRKTELGLHLKRNPGLSLLLAYMSLGYTISDYLEKYGTIPSVNQELLCRISQSIVMPCIGVSRPEYNPHAVVMQAIFRNFLKNNLSARGTELCQPLKEVVYRILRYENPVNSQFAQSVSEVRKFCDLCVIADYIINDAGSYEDDLLKLCFPGILSKSREPLTTNVEEYFRTWFENSEVPPGLRIILKAVVEGNLYREIAPLLAEKTRYAKTSLEKILRQGVYFFECLLTVHPSNYTVDELFRNPHLETWQVLNMIYEEVSSQNA